MNQKKKEKRHQIALPDSIYIIIQRRAQRNNRTLIGEIKTLLEEAEKKENVI